jgi:hypothetical protein
MRTLTGAQISATSSTVTTPGYFVEINFPTVLRLSTRDSQSWGGYTWTGGRLGRVSGLSSDGKGEQRGRLELINTDLAYSALVLGDGVAERGCRVWTFYGDNPADATLILDGVIDSADEINADRVVLSVVGESLRTAEFLRRFIGPGTGFNNLRPSGTKVTWDGQVYVLERK